MKKKVVKLNESDIERLVNKILKEDFEVDSEYRNIVSDIMTNMVINNDSYGVLVTPPYPVGNRRSYPVNEFSPHRDNINPRFGFNTYISDKYGIDGSDIDEIWDMVKQAVWDKTH